MIALDTAVIKDALAEMVRLAHKYPADAFDDTIFQIAADRLATDLENAMMEQWQAELYQWHQSLGNEEAA